VNHVANWIETNDAGSHGAKGAGGYVVLDEATETIKGLRFANAQFITGLYLSAESLHVDGSPSNGNTLNPFL